MAKVFIVLSSVMAIVLSCLVVSTAARWKNAQDLLEEYQKMAQQQLVRANNIESTKATLLAIRDETVAQERALRNAAEDRAAEIADELAAKNIDLSREINDRVAADAGRKKLEEILGSHTDELNGLRKRYEELLAEKIDLQTRNQRLGSRVLELTSENTVSKDEIRNLQQKLYAAEQQMRTAQQSRATVAAAVPQTPIGVTTAAPITEGPIEGEVVEVDGRYVSLNIGSASGVVEGMPFMVRRGGQYVADVRVESVQPKQAGGKVTLLKPGEQIRRGDRVSFGLDK